MKITNGQIVVILESINKIKKSDRVLPIRLSYVINKNMQILMDYYKPYMESLKEYGFDSLSKDELAELPSDKLIELNSLYTYENDINMHKVKLEDILDADLTINEMEIIQTFMMD